MNLSIESNKTRILIVDDNPSIHEDIRRILACEDKHDDLAEEKNLLFQESSNSSQKTAFEIESAFQGQEGLQKVQEAEAAGRPFALAFVDVRMPPGWDGMETIGRIWEKYPQLQVVVCTAYSDYSWEEMTRRIGKSDSLVILKKPFDNIEVLQLAHALTEKWRLGREVQGRLKNLDLLVGERTAKLESANEQLKKEIAERVVLEKALRLSEERFSKAFKASPIPLTIQSLRQGYYVDANLGFQQLTGFTRDELIGHASSDLGLWADPAQQPAMLRTLQDQMSVRNMPCELKTKSGQIRQALVSAELFDLGDEPFLLTITQDITEQIGLENQLRQAQKMEAVGQLAAGVAHDFNNRLAVILGHASLHLDGMPADSSERKTIQSIIEAAEKATKLVRQLLTFSRKQVIQIQPVAVDKVLSSIEEMLPRILGEDIAVQIHPPPGPLRVNADSGMLEQMLMNLAVNARDAMPAGGQLAISAETVEFNSPPVRQNEDAHPGLYLRLTAADTGSGIPPELLPRIFEPFFTTKPIGKGTGLGLATVYGIAKQHGGWVEVQSQLGQGAAFHIYLPACEEAIGAAAVPLIQQPLKGGQETILVAEDDDDVRNFVVTVLSSHGYKVVDAHSGKEALAVWAETDAKIDLLLTDMVMPGGMTGRQLAENLLSKDSSLRVLYTSGYSPGMAGKDLGCLAGHDFLAKPYESATLVRRVRDRLDGRQNHPAEFSASSTN